MTETPSPVASSSTSLNQNSRIPSIKSLLQTDLFSENKGLFNNDRSHTGNDETSLMEVDGAKGDQPGPQGTADLPSFRFDEDENSDSEMNR